MQIPCADYSERAEPQSANNAGGDGITLRSEEDKEDNGIPLIQAVASHRIDKVRVLLERDPDAIFSERDKYHQNQTAIIRAVIERQVDILRLLLEGGGKAVVNEQDKQKMTAIMHAATDNDFEIFRLLLEHGADVDAEDSNWDTALMHAAADSPVEILRMLLERGADETILWTSRSGHTALMSAAARNTTEAVRLLLEHGAGQTISEKDQSGCTALMYAVASNGVGVETVRLLLEHGAAESINEIDKSNRTPLMRAAESNKAEVVQLLLENGAGSSINNKDEDGFTALMRAARSSRVDLVRLLLDHGAGATMNEKNKWGMTALMHAVEGQDLEVICLLLELGANPNDKDADNWTALMCAAFVNDAGKVRILLEKGSALCINECGKNGVTALMAAAVNKCDTDVISVLLEYGAGASINAKDCNGVTALMHAASTNNSDAVRLLLQHGADASINDKDAFGSTALLTASRRPSQQILLGGSRIRHKKAVSRKYWTSSLMNSAKSDDDIDRMRLLVRFDETVDALMMKEDEVVEEMQNHARPDLDPDMEPLDWAEALSDAKAAARAEAEKLLYANTSEKNSKQAAVVALLLKYGAVMNEEEGITALMKAVNESNVDVARVFLDHGVDVSKASEDGWNILFIAHAYDMVRLLLEHGAGSKINDVDERGRSALSVYLASCCMYRGGDVNVVRLMLDSGAKIDIVDEVGETILYKAAQGHIDILQLLLDHGAAASINTKTSSGRTVLMQAAAANSVEAVCLLLDHGADQVINDIDEKGESALMLAVWDYHVDVVRLLLDRGADPSVLSRTIETYDTLLMEAIRRKNEGLVAVLLEHGAGATIHQQDERGRTALMKVASKCGVRTIRLLLEHGAVKSINVKDNMNRTALAIAVDRCVRQPECSLDAVCLLLERGASPRDISLANIRSKRLLLWCRRRPWLLMVAACARGSSDGVSHHVKAILGLHDIVRQIAEYL